MQARRAPRAAVADAVVVGSRSDRLVWSLLGVIASGVVVIAYALSPDPSGMGTHQQLGLPPCGFLYFTGLPCPGCGLTTSFAHMARMQITSAVAAHPLGVPLFMLTWLAIPATFFACVRGAPFVTTIERLPVAAGLMLLAVAALLVWFARVVSIFVA